MPPSMARPCPVFKNVNTPNVKSDTNDSNRKMEELQLAETLQRYFSDVFLCCDEDKCGSASLNKTVELIKSGNVPDDVIEKISDICWGHAASANLNRRQFFSALKLVAAYQANIPIQSEIVTSNLELPLPRFTWNSDHIDVDDKSVPDLIELSELSDTERIDGDCTDSEVESDTLSIVRNGSPGISSTASDSPTPTNSVQDRNWAVGGAWHGAVSEEQRQLLGTEEESSDKHSSEEDTEVSSEIWTINSEQRDYYTNQFRSLQSDVNALLPGPVARMFFEKSRLPVHELRKIWQLADVTKDGALSLQEFNTAMHLVVLRRNHIELPDVLPASLIPGNETPLSVSPETEPMLSPQTKDTAKEWTKFVDSPTSSVSSPGPKPVNFDFQKITLDNKDSKILHPVPLRLTPECSTASGATSAPVLPPVATAPTNEDLVDSVVEAPSPKKFVDVVVPVGCGLGTNNNNSAIQRPQPKKITLPGPGAIPPPPPTTGGGAESENNSNNGGVVVVAGPVSLPAFPPPKKEKPPPPPPRPFKTHGRSSSLDLNRLTRLGAPPTVPPRVSPNINPSSTSSSSTGKKLINQRSEGDCGVGCVHADGDGSTPFANFEEFEKYENVPEGIFPGDVYEAERKKLFARFHSNEAPRKHGAFEVYRKPQKENSPVNTDDKAKWELFQKLQEENTVLLRICQELSQELADIREEKMTLKHRLDKLVG